MGIATALVMLPLLQAPVGQEPAERFIWPPVTEAPLRYRARLQKTRTLSDELFKAEREARRELGLPAPSRQPRQSMALEIDIELRGGDDAVSASYTTRIHGRPDLRLKLLPSREGEQLLPLGNDRLQSVWGLPDGRKREDLEISRAAIERTFEQTFRRGRRGVEPASFDGSYGDHLLPLLWDQPLPCWFGHTAAVVELAGEAAIEGKTLIRDGTGSFPFGHRESRVEIEFIKASGRAFTVSYQLQIRQVVCKTRDLRANLPAPFDWRFEIEGEAEYSAADQAFTRIRETVKAWPEKLPTEGLARLRDEAFVGEIEIERVRDQPPKTGRKRRRL